MTAVALLGGRADERAADAVLKRALDGNKGKLTQRKNDERWLGSDW